MFKKSESIPFICLRIKYTHTHIYINISCKRILYINVFYIFTLFNKIFSIKEFLDIYIRHEIFRFFKLLQFSNEKHTNNPSSAGFLPWCNKWGLIFEAHESEREYHERSDSCPNKWNSRAYCNPTFPRKKNTAKKNAFKSTDIKWKARDVKFPDLCYSNRRYSCGVLVSLFSPPSQLSRKKML